MRDEGRGDWTTLPHPSSGEQCDAALLAPPAIIAVVGRNELWRWPQRGDFHAEEISAARRAAGTRSSGGSACSKGGGSAEFLSGSVRLGPELEIKRERPGGVG
jgi:hypothetical protein